MYDDTLWILNPGVYTCICGHFHRLRGVHSITNKAKGRHVGMIEER